MHPREPQPSGDCPLRLVLATFPDESTAQSIARRLVESGLAACVNLLPGARSIYSWQGKIEEGTEVLGIIKTTAQCLPSLEKAFLEQHPYEVPEFVALEPCSAQAAYLEWVVKNTR